MTKSTGLFDNDLNHSPQKNKIIGVNLIFKFIFLNYGNRFWPGAPCLYKKLTNVKAKSKCGTSLCT